MYVAGNNFLSDSYLSNCLLSFDYRYIVAYASSCRVINGPPGLNIMAHVRLFDPPHRRSARDLALVKGDIPLTRFPSYGFGLLSEHDKGTT